MPRGKASEAQRAAARRNGRHGGRPRKVRITEEQKAAALEALAQERFRIERPANLQFLVDVRDGLVPGVTTLDRMRAVENMLDRDPNTVRRSAEREPGGGADVAPPKLFELGDAPAFDAPAGWQEQPMVEAEDTAGPSASRQNGANAAADKPAP